MRNLLIAFATVVLAGPAFASSLSFDLKLAFEKEVFWNVLLRESGELIDQLEDGDPYGFADTFSDLESGDVISASFTLDEVVEDFYAISSCDFGGLSCVRDDAFVSADMTKFTFDSLDASTFTFDLSAGTATYYEDGPGGSSDAGFYSFYGAEFSLVRGGDAEESVAVVPLPAGALMLFGGLGLLLGLRKQQRRGTAV